MSRIFLSTTLLICTLVFRAASWDDRSLRSAWLDAPKSQGTNWNRTALLERLMTGVKLDNMPRASVLQLFGRPGFSAESNPEPRSRIDVYRISAANDKSLRIDYDPADKVTTYSVQSSPCHCDLCIASAPLLSAALLDKSGLRKRPLHGDLTMSALEKMLGRPGKVDLSRNSVGGQLWLNYSEVWRVYGAPNQFLLADGHVPARDAPNGEIRDKRVGSWALISFAPECLAK